MDKMSSTRFGREMGKKYEKRKSGSARLYVGIRLNESVKPGKGFRVMY